jgi:hypothetical protein
MKKATAFILIAIYLCMILIVLYGDYQSRKTMPPSLMNVFNDGRLTDEEREYLRGLSCDDVKRIMGTTEEICLYIMDENGELVDLLGTGTYGIGCPVLDAEGNSVCPR